MHCYSALWPPMLRRSAVATDALRELAVATDALSQNFATARCGPGAPLQRVATARLAPSASSQQIATTRLGPQARCRKELRQCAVATDVATALSLNFSTARCDPRRAVEHFFRRRVWATDARCNVARLGPQCAVAMFCDSAMWPRHAVEASVATARCRNALRRRACPPDPPSQFVTTPRWAPDAL